jgi:phosphatidate cytidylyltransferase
MKSRVITAIIGAALFLSLLIVGNLPFAILILLIALIGYYEYIRMNNTKILSITGMWGALAVLLIFIDNIFLEQKFSFIIILSMIIGYFLILIFSKNKVNFDIISYILLGVIYLSLSFLAMIEVRAWEDGLIIFLFILAANWGSDIGAFLVGVKFGKHKLAPAISPKKTIEGSIGGLAFALLVALGFGFALSQYKLPILIIAALTISIIGQFGDLIESALKRTKEVKDSGTLLPGHGGILDRFDSLILIFFVIYVLNLFI